MASGMIKNGKLLRFELNKEGVRKLMQSPEMQHILEQQASDVIPNNGYDYEVGTVVKGTRAVTHIEASGYKTIRHEQKSNDLLKAIKGGGGR